MSMSRGIPFRWCSRCVLEAETDLAFGSRVDPFRRSHGFVTRTKSILDVARFPFSARGLAERGGKSGDRKMDDRKMGR